MNLLALVVASKLILYSDMARATSSRASSERIVGIRHEMAKNSLGRRLAATDTTGYMVSERPTVTVLRRHHRRARSHLMPTLLASEQQFNHPVYHGHRIAWCLQNGIHCGKATADAWCQSKNYQAAKAYTIEPHVTSAYIIGEQRLCLHQSCASFKSIVCEKTLNNVQQLKLQSFQGVHKFMAV